MLQFQHTEYLIALAAVPMMVLMYSFLIKWKRNTTRKIGDPLLVKQLIKDYSPAKFAFKFILFITAFTIMVIALANPRLPQGSTSVNRTGIDVMIALDVSKSMLAQDIKPDRLERAKQVLAKLIDRLEDDRIGIVVFAGRAYLQMPLTTDHGAAKMYLSSVSPEAMPTQGTVIGDALKMSAASFNSKEKKYKSIILVSDGEDHDENAVNYAKALAAEGVMINTIGIGSPEGAMITDPETNEYKKDQAGNPVITKLNEAELRSIAENGNGVYQYFTNSDEVVSTIEAQLKTMGQRPITENSLINYRNLFPWFLALALLLLIAEFFISEIRKVQIKKPLADKKNKMKVAPFGCILLLFAPFASMGQKDNKLVKKGNEAYNNQQYDLAVDNYKKAVEKNPENLPAQYNLGNALYKGQKTEDALSAYDAAIQHSKLPIEKSGAYYNKGVVLQNEKKLPDCIEAYKDALRLNPADEDARLNLQKALLQQKQQQQQEKDNKEKKKQKDDPKQKEKQKEQAQKDKDEPPKPQPSKMTKREAEEKLKALLQQEKKLQDKLRKVNAASSSRPDKDW